jgi:Inhibitor of vertebrate lysozyme (Ivy)
MAIPSTGRRAIALTVAICMPSLLNAKLSSAEDGVYGGVYSNACGDRSQPMVRLYGDVMSVERAGTVVTARPFRADAKHLGASPPADFKTAYIGEVKGGDRLVFVLFHNKDGLFVLLEGGPKSLAPLGPGVMGLELRHCDPNRNALPGAPVAKMIGPPDLLRDPKFKTPYMKALGPLSREPWLTSLDGPAPEVKKLQVAGGEYQLAAVCMPHDCYENSTVLLYDAAAGVVFGKVYQAGRSTLIGNPPPQVAGELERLWLKQFRQRP